MTSYIPFLVGILAFLSAAGVVLFVGHRIADTLTVQRRLPAPLTVDGASQGGPIASQFLGALNRIDEKRFGIEGALRTKLRRNLMRAGFFSENAIQTYIIIRVALFVALPALALVMVSVFHGDGNLYLRIAIVACAVLVGLFGVDAYISRKQSVLQYENRALFPDLIDMLVVCVDAGLSLNPALARVAPEIGRRGKNLENNLVLLGAEIRAGRSTAEALASFAERLSFDEVRSLAILLRQSLELGTDVADALRAFSEEMRAKRLLRAEEIANKLPVKMVLPLGLCIFPVILMVVMVPVVFRLLLIFHAF